MERRNPLLFPKTLTTVEVDADAGHGAWCRLITYKERRGPRYPLPVGAETRARTVWMEDHVQGPCYVHWADHEAWRMHARRCSDLRSHPVAEWFTPSPLPSQPHVHAGVEGRGDT